MNKKNLEMAIKLRHELHENPELSNQEVWTKQHLIDFIKTNTKLEIVDRGTWFYAIYNAGEGKENIAFRADFDAIPVLETCELPYSSKFPGIAHKCGHDGHSATLAAFALEVDQNGADKNIYFLFQHAEETGDGAKECATFIEEHNINEIFAFHNMPGFPLNTVAVRDGIMHCASKGMSIYMKGVPTHASIPENGKNPSYAIAEIIKNIPDLIKPENYKGLILCTIVQIDVGQKAFGVAASEGVLRLTLRGQYEEEMNNLQRNIEQITEEQAKIYGLECYFEFDDVFPETKNHEESVDKIKAVCKDLDIKCIDLPDPQRGSEDFGYYTKLTKGAIFIIGNGFGPGIHTSEYDFNDDIIEMAVKIYKKLIVDF